MPIPTLPKFSESPPDADEQRDLIRRRNAAWEAANVPERYKGAKLDDLSGVPDESLSAYREAVGKIKVLLDRRCTMALIGHVGPGKTWMACALVREFCKHARSAIYLEAMDYFVALQETYGDGAKANASTIEAKYIKPELLVLDAMEERADTDWNDRMLVRLVNKRYAAEKSTILISNEEKAAFTARVGASIADRIRDDGGIVTCGWKSLRGRINHA